MSEIRGEDAVDRAAAASCAAASPGSPARPVGRVWRSEEILAGAREVVIVHKGMRYRLLETRQGKLILNK